MKTNVKICLVAIVVGLCGCEKDMGEYDKQITENDAIKGYIAAHDLDMEESSTGLFYNIQGEGIGNKPEMKDYVIYEYTIRLFDSTLIHTTDSILAKENDAFDSTVIYGPDKRQVKEMMMGISEALTYMKPNSTAFLIVPYNLGKGDKTSRDGKIPAYSTLLINLALHKVITDPVAHEKNEIGIFLEQHKGFSEIADGLYYKKVTWGNEKVISAINTLDVSLDMKMIDGRKLTSSQLSLPSNDIPLVEGLKQGILLMSEGEKGEFIIRSDLAYGHDTKKAIPPYSTIWVEVEINEIF
jgi:FKBP-type peptidyl-prolyl cis-trans isomerase